MQTVARHIRTKSPILIELDQSIDSLGDGTPSAEGAREGTVRIGRALAIPAVLRRVLGDSRSYALLFGVERLSSAFPEIYNIGFTRDFPGWFVRSP